MTCCRVHSVVDPAARVLRPPAIRLDTDARTPRAEGFTVPTILLAAPLLVPLVRVHNLGGDPGVGPVAFGVPRVLTEPRPTSRTRSGDRDDITCRRVFGHAPVLLGSPIIASSDDGIERDRCSPTTPTRSRPSTIVPTRTGRQRQPGAVEVALGRRARAAGIGDGRADGETRTLTDGDLNAVPLPIGLRRRTWSGYDSHQPRRRAGHRDEVVSLPQAGTDGNTGGAEVGVTLT